jgi:septal ring factor EnvC (AmiA/AmiB activator)
MANQTTLNKEFVIKNGGVVITETIEKQLSKEELQAEKAQYINRQAQLTRQISELQKQYNSIDAAIADIDSMIEIIDQDTTKQGEGINDNKQVL